MSTNTVILIAFGAWVVVATAWLWAFGRECKPIGRHRAAEGDELPLEMFFRSLLEDDDIAEMRAKRARREA